jgi:hypothetical protein
VVHVRDERSVETNVLHVATVATMASGVGSDTTDTVVESHEARCRVPFPGWPTTTCESSVTTAERDAAGDVHPPAHSTVQTR